MLRMARRWHDAANGPLDGEARLLYIKRSEPYEPLPQVPAQAGETPEQAAERIAENARRARQNAEGPIARIQKETQNSIDEKAILNADLDHEKNIKAVDLVSHAENLHERLQAFKRNMETVENEIKQRGADESIRKQAEENKKIIDTQEQRIYNQIRMLQMLPLDRWERGDLTPSEFIDSFAKYVDEMRDVDAKDDRLNPKKRRERDIARKNFLARAREARDKALKKLPAALPMQSVQNAMPDMNERDIWNLYTQKERDFIINEINDSAGINAIKTNINDDVEIIETELKKKDLDRKLPQLHKQAADLHSDPEDFVKEKEEKHEGLKIFEPVEEFFGSIQGGINAFNEWAGLEWMSFYEWSAAFNEVVESIKELRKRRSIARVARGALVFGEIASFIPGMGGDDLVMTLEEQQQHKQDEVKDAYVKELKRKDYGFTDLFGDGEGKRGELQKFIQIGDTNRSRAVLEFAASKALLYDIEGKSAEDYKLPGGIPFRDAMPPEWSEKEVNTTLGNLQYANNQGIDAQVKAGEAFVKGRATFEGYTEPFKQAVNGMGLWFAKGVAEAALDKVKEGHMSTTLALIVLDAWEHNELFRRYVTEEWLDRLAGNRPLLFRMLKFDKGHLVEGARGTKNKANITHDLAQADANGHDKDPKNRGKQRLGPFVVATRKYLKKKDPSLRGTDPETKKRLDELVAKVLAGKYVGPGDGLPEGVYASVFSSDLIPYHIQYNPNEARDAAVDKIGDDFFIEESELKYSTGEVIKSIGEVTTNGFKEPTKARYFFSHMLDTYDRLNKSPLPEFKRAADNFLRISRPKLDQWLEVALSREGGKSIILEQHKNQDGRYLILSLLEAGLISMSLVERLANGAGDQQRGNQAAKTLLKQYQDRASMTRPLRDDPGAANAPQPSTAA